MKKNALLAALIVTTGALALVVVRQRCQIADLKKAVENAARKDIVSARPSPPVTPKEPPAPAAETAPSEPTVMPVPTPTASPSPAAPAGAAAASNLFSGLAGMMKNPQMKEMVRAQQKMALEQMYGALPRYLDVPADKLDALKSLLLDRQMAMVDAGLSAMGGSASDRKQAVENTKTLKEDYDKKIQDLLGPQDYQVFQDYEKTVAERMQVQMFKSSLPADAALTEQQEYDLISAIYEERKALPSSSLLNNKNPDPSQLTEEKIDEMLQQLEQLQQRYTNRAAAVLSPQQLEQFQQFLNQQRAMQTMGMKMASQMFGNKAAPQPPAASQSPAP